MQRLGRLALEIRGAGMNRIGRLAIFAMLLIALAIIWNWRLGHWYSCPKPANGIEPVVKFVTDRLYADPDAAARELVAIANSVEKIQDSVAIKCPLRFSISKLAAQFCASAWSPPPVNSV
jgi:hypothetical protein